MIKDSWFCKKVRGLGFKIVDSCMSDKMKAGVLEIFTNDIQTINTAEEILDDDKSGFCVASEITKEVTLCNSKIDELELKVDELERVILLQRLHVGMLKRVVEMYQNNDIEKHSN